MLYLEDLNSGQIVRGVTIKNPLRAGDVTLGGFLESGGEGEKRYYSFTPPIVIPTTKYFCKNGYTTRIGKVATMVIEARILIGVTIPLAAPLAAATAIEFASFADALEFWLDCKNSISLYCKE